MIAPVPPGLLFLLAFGPILVSWLLLAPPGAGCSLQPGSMAPPGLFKDF